MEVVRIFWSLLSAITVTMGFGQIGPSRIEEPQSLQSIEKKIEQEADSETLVLFDVDHNLITPQDPILRLQHDKMLDRLTGGKVIEEGGKKRYLFREIVMSAPHSLIDPASVSLVRRLQDKGIPAIAFTAAPGGKIRPSDREDFIDWRIRELRGFGFDFSPAFADVETLVLPKKGDQEFPPRYSAGVLITSLHDKGSVLKDFIAEIQQRLGWVPKKIIFIDDQRSNLESVKSAFEDQIQTVGFHYTAAAELPCEPLDEKAAQYQVEHFRKTGEWISQFEAQERLKGHE